MNRKDNEIVASLISDEEIAEAQRMVALAAEQDDDSRRIALQVVNGLVETVGMMAGDMLSHGEDPRDVLRAIAGQVNYACRDIKPYSQRVPRRVRGERIDEGEKMLGQLMGKYSAMHSTTHQRLAELQTKEYEERELLRTIRRLQEGHDDMRQRMLEISLDGDRF